MNDRDEFLRAIRANPDDDTTRLVLADWLDEHDDPLGAFIRVQIELDPIRFRIDNPRAVELHAREDELLRRYRDEWVGDVAHFPNPADFGPVFRRGFPDYACLSLDTFLSHGEALFATCPTLREVALYGVANRCSELTLSPLLAELDTLEIADWPTEDDAISLSVSPYLELIPRFKLWLGGEPWMLREFVRQATEASPREIELVQVYGGAGTNALALNEEADAVAREANEQLKREVVRVTRPFECLFPIHNDIGCGFFPGRLPDGRPALATRMYMKWALITFTEDGCVQEVTERGSLVQHGDEPGHYSEVHLPIGSEFEEWVKEEWRLVPGIIWVREFDREDLQVGLWRDSLQHRYDHPPPHPFEEWWTEEKCGEARSWLEQRNFVISQNNEFWADWQGTIHSS